MGRLEAYLVYYRDGRIKKSLEWLSPMEYRRKLGYAQAWSKKSSAPPWRVGISPISYLA